MDDISNYFLDIEFQTYLINRPVNEHGVEDTSADPLLNAGYAPEATRTFVNVTVDGVTRSFYQYAYQFVLSIGILIITPANERSYRFARFPLLVDDGAFRIPRILVPNYTFAGSGQAELVAAYESLHLPPFEELEFGDFPSLDKLTAEQEGIARSMFQIYSNNLSQAEAKDAKQFLLNLAMDNKRGKLRVITQGISDINALKNTYIKYSYHEIPNFPHKDITPISKFYKKIVPLPNAKLSTVKTYIVGEAYLMEVEKTITSEIVAYMTDKYGAAVGSLVAHNPLIDSMYVYLVLLGYKRSGRTDVVIKETKAENRKGGRRRHKRHTKRKRHIRRTRKYS